MIAFSLVFSANNSQEIHLQAAIQSNTTGSNHDTTSEIPAPKTSEGLDIKYDELYSLLLKKPATYIRFSQTVEECTGCQYNMTTADDTFLKAYNKSRPKNSRLSEDDFEKLMELFEEEASIQAPFASLDGTVILYSAFEPTVLKVIEPKVQGFASDVYLHWAAQRNLSHNTPLQPVLKLEKDQQRDDQDPYVCFRRREGRVIRKTRNRDQQFAEKLKKLRREIAEGQILINMTLQRETTKKDLLAADRAIFRMRGEVKRNKIKLGIKTDDDDLINHKVRPVPDSSNGVPLTIIQPQKRKPTLDNSQLQRPLGPPMRLPARSDGRAPDAELIQLSDVMAQKENMLRIEVESKAEQHRLWNINHIDLTREPLLPVFGQGPDTGFRAATAQYQYLMTPPSSVTSETFDQASPSHEAPEPILARYGSPAEEEEHHGPPEYRRRIGRGGRMWIDRRKMSSATPDVDSSIHERWKYDQDDDDEQPVYEVDPYDTRALRFRATIPFPPHLLPQRSRHEPSPLARVAGANPANIKAANSSAQPQPQPQQVSQGPT